MKTVKFKLPEREIDIVLETIDDTKYSDYIKTSRFRPKGSTSELISQTDSLTLEKEFIADLNYFIERINLRNETSPESAIAALKESCINHINKYGRLKIADLQTYVDCFLHVLVYAFEEQFPNLEMAQKVYGIYQKNIEEEYQQYIKHPEFNPLDPLNLDADI